MSAAQQPLPVKTLSNGDVVVEISDGTTPSQKLSVDASGKIITKLNDGAGNAVTSQVNGGQQALDVGINVAGAQVDPRSIRALTSLDVVTSAQGSANTAANGWPVKPTDGTNSASFTAAGETKVSVTQALPTGANTIGSVNQGTSPWVIGQSTAANLNAQVRLQDGTGNAITSSTAGSTRPLDTALRDSSGNLYSSSNPLPVSFASALSGTAVNKYNTTSAVAAGATTNHDYAITAGKTFYGKKFWASSAGMIRADVQTSPDGTTFTTFWTGFSSAAFPVVNVDLDQLTIADAGVGAKVRIVITNFEATAAEDVFSTISGTEQ